MRKQPNKTKPAPATKITWNDRATYDRAKAAAGTIPLATFVLDLIVRELDKRSAA